MTLFAFEWILTFHLFLAQCNKFFVSDELESFLDNTKFLYRINKNSQTSQIFLSSTDVIYAINTKNIDEISFLTTGPRNFSIFCEENQNCAHCSAITSDYPPGYSSKFCQPRLTSNIVKSWATLNPFHHDYFGYDQRIFTGFHLYTCFNLYHGFCTKIHLDQFKGIQNKNISSLYSNLERFIPVVGWNPRGSSTLFIDNSSLLAIHQTDQYESHSLIESFSYTIRNHSFTYPSESMRGVYSMDLVIKSKPPDLHYLKTFKAKSLSGFDYIYTIYTEKLAHRNHFKLKMSRICSGDDQFNSFVEIDGFATDNGHNFFDNITHIVEGRSGQLLGDEVNHDILSETNTLEGLMGGENNSSLDIFVSSAYQKQRQETLLYLSVVEQANYAFDQTIHACFTGDGTRGPKYFFSTPLPTCQAEILPEDYKCLRRDHKNRLTMSENNIRQSFKMFFIDAINDEVTGLSLTISPDAMATLLYVNVKSGYILKYELIKIDGKYGRLIGRIPLILNDQRVLNSAIHLQVDMTGTFGYTLIKERNKILKFNLHDCSRFKKCSDCLNAKEPFCGWCISKGKCDRVENCFGDENSFNPDRIYSNEDFQLYSQYDVTIKDRRWLSYLDSIARCPIIHLVKPKGIFLTTPKPQPITLRDLQKSNEPLNLSLHPDERLRKRIFELTIYSNLYELACVFSNDKNEKIYRSSVEYSFERNSINCLAPSEGILKLENTQQGYHKLESQLEVIESTEHGRTRQILATGIIPIYNCSKMTSCSECVTLESDCVWCTQLNSCSYRDTDECRISDGELNLPNLNRAIEQNEISKCPKYSGLNGNPKLVYENSPVELIFLVSNVPIKYVTFHCIEECRGSSVVGVRINETSISCSFKKIQLPPDNTEGTAICPIKLLWSFNNQRYSPDSMEFTQIEVYDCGRLARYCDDCLSLRVEYECGFCQGIRDENPSQNVFGKCSRQRDCVKYGRRSLINEDIGINLGDSWIINGQICPNPSINMVLPMNTTHFGNTMFTIHGHNLGRTPDDIFSIEMIISKVDNTTNIVGYAPCDKKHHNSRKITCILRLDELKLDQNEDYHGSMRIIIGSGHYPALWNSLRIVSPKIHNFKPQIGPISGGTEVTFFGSNLNVGNQMVILIGYKPCRIFDNELILNRLSNHLVKCRTEILDKSFYNYAIYNMKYPVGVEVNIDNSRVYTEKSLDPFVYMMDPEVNSFLGNDVFLSGGTIIEFSGSNLEIIQSPRLVISQERDSFHGQICQIVNDNYQCLVPNLKSLTKDTGSAHLNFGLLLDNVESVRKIGKLNVYEDPLMDVFNKSESDYRQEIVTRSSSKNNNQSISHIIRLFGKFPTIPNLKIISQISIDRHPCVIENILSDEIRCMVLIALEKADEKAPVEDQLRFGTIYHVHARFGQSIEYSLGSIRFKLQTSFLSDTLPSILIASTISLVLILIIILALVMTTKYYSKNNYLKRTIDKVIAEQQLETERSLKEGFVAIQNACVKSVSIPSHLNAPVRTYDWFSVFTLFPDLHAQLTFPIDPIIFQENPSSLTYLNALNEYKDEKVSDQMEFELNCLYESLRDAKFFNYLISLLDQTLSVREKSHAVSLITAIFNDDLVYLTDIMVDQIKDLCSNINRTNAISSFRSIENFVVKLISNWLIILSYDHLKRHISKPLYELVEAFKEMLLSEPQDCVTGTAVSSLNLDKMLKCNLNPSYYNVTVLLMEKNYCDNHNQLVYLNGLEENKISVVLLSCDTVAQAKSKILNKLYKSVPFSKQLKPHHFDLGMASYNDVEILSDFNQKDDSGMLFFGSVMPLNKLSDFNIDNGSVLYLIKKVDYETRNTPIFKCNQFNDAIMKARSLNYFDCDNHTISSGFHSGQDLFQQKKNQISNAFRVNGLYSTTHWFHLESQHEPQDYLQRRKNYFSTNSLYGPMRKFQRYQSYNEILMTPKKNETKSIINLSWKSREKFPRDLHPLPIQYYSLILKETKTKLNPFMNHLMESIFDESHLDHDPNFMTCFKFLFNLLETIAREKFDSDAEYISKAWKSNCLHLLLWNQLLLNPDYILDVELVRNTAFSHSFHTICQVISYASVNKDQIPRRLSVSEMSAVKNIYIPDILNYSKKISKFFNRLNQGVPVVKENLKTLLIQHSRTYGGTFNRNWLLLQLYQSYLKPIKHLIFEGKLNYISIKKNIEDFQKACELIDPHLE